MSDAVLCTPLRVEQFALRGAARTLRVIHTGMGPRRATTAAATLPATTPVLVAGVAAAQSPHIRPGDVVVATEVRTGTAPALPNLTVERSSPCGSALLFSSGRGGLVPGSVEIPSAVLLAGALRGLGLTVHLGAVRSVGGIVWKPLGDGAVAVDMESVQLAPASAPFAVVRVIVDTPDHPLWHVGTLWRGVRALRTLAACRPALEWWAAAIGSRQLVIIEPGSWGAEIARQVDLVLVVGLSHLRKLVQREGVPAYFVNDASGIDLRWLAGRTRLGITAPAQLVPEIVHCLRGLGAVTTSELPAPREVS